MSIDPANAATPLLQHGERLENASLILSGLNQGYPLTREGRNSLDATLTSGSLGLVVDCFQQEYEALAPNSTFVERRFEFLIKPACAVVGHLLSMLVNGNFQPAQLSSYVLLLPAANEINEYLFYVDESESPANQDLTSALGSAMVLIFAAREYIDYRYDARQLAYVIPANSLALQVAQSF